MLPVGSSPDLGPVTLMEPRAGPSACKSSKILACKRNERPSSLSTSGLAASMRWRELLHSDLGRLESLRASY